MPVGMKLNMCTLYVRFFAQELKACAYSTKSALLASKGRESHTQYTQLSEFFWGNPLDMLRQQLPLLSCLPYSCLHHTIGLRP